MMSRATELSKLILLTGMTDRLFTSFAKEIKTVTEEYERLRQKFPKQMK